MSHPSVTSQDNPEKPEGTGTVERGLTEVKGLLRPRGNLRDTQITSVSLKFNDSLYLIVWQIPYLYIF